jgi:transcriptional regulator with XRE-family HTH domain
MSARIREVQSKDQQSGPGRRAKQAENALGIFIQKRLAAKRITQSEFAQLLGVTRDIVHRLIHDSPSKLHASLEERIYQVLELNDTERQQFQQILSNNSCIVLPPVGLPERSTDIYPSIPHISSHSPATSSDVSREDREVSREKRLDGRGRAAKPVESELGKFLDTHIRSVGIKRSQLAQQVGVSPSTITRFVNGNTSAIQRETKDRICQVLGFDGVIRSQFYRLASAERIPVISIHQFSDIDLDVFENRLRENQFYFDKGLIEAAMLNTREHYSTLKRRFPGKKEKRAANLRWGFGILYATAMEAYLPWEGRSRSIISIYSDIVEDVQNIFTVQEAAAPYLVQIQARLAPMYRELDQFKESLGQFTGALDKCLHFDLKSTPEYRKLLVELYYSRAHVYAIQGREDLWRRDIGFAKMRAQEEKDPERYQYLAGLITYTEGEGYKRLATEGQGYGGLALKLKDRQKEFAIQGLRCFEQAHVQMEGSKWVGHGILNKVAMAQCMALVEPDAAINLAMRLRTDAQKSYPSIVQKIDNTIKYAQKRLQ